MHTKHFYFFKAHGRVFHSPERPDHTDHMAAGFFWRRKAVFVEYGENESVFGFHPCGKNVFVEETFVILTDGEILACEKPLQLLVDHRKLLMLH